MAKEILKKSALGIFVDLSTILIIWLVFSTWTAYVEKISDSLPNMDNAAISTLPATESILQKYQQGKDAMVASAILAGILILVILSIASSLIWCYLGNRMKSFLKLSVINFIWSIVWIGVIVGLTLALKEEIKYVFLVVAILLYLYFTQSLNIKFVKVPSFWALLHGFSEGIRKFYILIPLSGALVLVIYAFSPLWIIYYRIPFYGNLVLFIFVGLVSIATYRLLILHFCTKAKQKN